MTKRARDEATSQPGPGPQSRRTFLLRSGAAVSAAAVTGSVPAAAEARAGGAQQARLDPRLLGAVADVVLPGELGTEGTEAAVVAFLAWADGYEPVAELNHGYGTSEIPYGPPDPVPGWAAQLQALELEAGRRYEAGFADLSSDDRMALLGRHLARDGRESPGLPDPLQARHVAVALLAHWSESPDAVNACYGRRISPRTCRGLDDSSTLPEAVP